MALQDPTKPYRPSIEILETGKTPDQVSNDVRAGKMTPGDMTPKKAVPKLVLLGLVFLAAFFLLDGA